MMQDAGTEAAQALATATPHAGAAAHAAGAAAGHGAGETYDAGAAIFHHILDAPSLDLTPFGEVHLPAFHIGPFVLQVTKISVMLWIASAVVILILWLANRRRSLEPHGIHNVMEAMVQFVRDELARKNIGSHGDRYVSFLLTTFFFIFICNLLGVLPYMSTATGNISVTAGLAAVAFVMIQVSGIREYGLVKHFKNIVPQGMPAWLLIIMVPVEILGMLTKPFALCVRLFANMTAGHVVILSLFSIVFILKSVTVGLVMSLPFALFINGIELLVIFLQAYIFTMLTSLFIGMSVHPEH